MDYIENIESSINTINSNLTSLSELEIDIGTPLYHSLITNYDSLKKSLSTFDQLITAIRSGKKLSQIIQNNQNNSNIQNSNNSNVLNNSNQNENEKQQENNQNEKKEEIQNPRELTPQQKYNLSLHEFTRPEDRENAESRLETKEIIGSIGKMLGYNHVHLRYFYNFCPSNASFRNIIRYLCEKIAPFVFFVTLSNGQVIGIYFNKKCEATGDGEYHLKDKGMCIFGSHFENGNIVMDKYESINGHVQTRLDPQGDFFEVKIHGVGKFSTMPYKEMVENLFTYKVSQKPGSEKLFKGLTSPSLLCSEDLYCYVISMHIGIYRKNKFTVEKKPSIDLTQLEISFKDIVESEEKQPLEYYINKAKTEYGLSEPSVALDDENFPRATTNPSDPEAMTLASQWINLIRTKEMLHLLRQKFGYADTFTMSGVYHFTEYEMPHQLMSLEGIFGCRMETSMFYFFSMECMVGVSITKENRTKLGSHPTVLKLFAIFYKNNTISFMQFETKNSIVNDERRMNPYAYVDDEYRIHPSDSFIQLLQTKGDIKLNIKKNQKIPMVLNLYSSFVLPFLQLEMYTSNDLNTLTHVSQKMKTPEYQRSVKNGKLNILKLVNKKKK